jgi:hypothetical protein
MTLAQFVARARPGQTLCLADGTYGRIHIGEDVRGTQSQPITIRALNDGKVTIDAGTSRALTLWGQYVIVEGMNIHGGDNITVSMGGVRNILRRVVIWNNETSNRIDNMLDMAGPVDAYNVVEDCAVFGRARKLITVGASAPRATGNIVRRCWSQWEDRLPGGSPCSDFEMGYSGQSNVTFENVIGTNNPKPRALDGCWDWIEDPILIGNTKNSYLLGSIAYNGGVTVLKGEDDWHGGTYDITIKDTVALRPSSRPFSLWKQLSGSRSTVSNVAGVGSEKSPCASGWSGCNTIREGRTLAEATGGQSVFQLLPGLCKRYVNRQLTNEPLWPWPMNQRIMDAMRQSGREPVDITATMEALLGPIPPQCQGGEALSP